MDEEKKEIPEGMMGVMIMKEGDFRVGMSLEMPDHVLLVIPASKVALAFSVDKTAPLLHDLLCNVLGQILGEEPEETKNNEMVKRRLDN